VLSISIFTGLSVSSVTIEFTVGKSIVVPLKKIRVASPSLFSRKRVVTVTPWDTVNPIPSECIFVGSSWGMILKMQETFPGAKARAVCGIIFYYNKVRVPQSNRWLALALNGFRSETRLSLDKPLSGINPIRIQRVRNDHRARKLHLN
jgi:hypothetical protein